MGWWWGGGKAGEINAMVETKAGSRADSLRSGTFNPAWTFCHNVPSGPVFLSSSPNQQLLGFKGKENDIDFRCTIRTLD